MLRSILTRSGDDGPSFPPPFPPPMKEQEGGQASQHETMRHDKKTTRGSFGVMGMMNECLTLGGGEGWPTQPTCPTTNLLMIIGEKGKRPVALA